MNILKKVLLAEYNNKQSFFHSVDKCLNLIFPLLLNNNHNNEYDDNSSETYVQNSYISTVTHKDIHIHNVAMQLTRIF